MKVGLALGAGGAKGLCHIAFLKALDEIGVKPALISGSSIGAIIGGLYAAGISGAHLEQTVQEVGFVDLARIALDFSLLSKSALFKGRAIEDLIARLVSARTFEDLTIPLKVVATDFWNRRQVVFQSGELLPAIRASMALPAIFEPVRQADAILIDGGAVNPLPYDLIQDDCDLTIAIDVSGQKICLGDNPVPSILESVLSTFQIMQAAIVEEKRRCSPPDIYVRPELVNIRTLDFYRHAEILESVAPDVAKFKENLLGRLSTGKEDD